MAQTREGFAATTDVALFRKGPDGSLQTLLIKRGGQVEIGKWAMPGGHVDAEDAADLALAAARELREETGIQVEQFPYPIHLRYVGLREAPDRSWIGHTFWGIVSPHHDTLGLQAADDAAEVRWVTASQLSQLEVAFDHRQVLESLFQLTDKIIT